jgi:HSP20 family protein
MPHPGYPFCRWIPREGVIDSMAGASSRVPTDVYRSGNHYVVACDLPGIDPGSLDVVVNEDLVTIRAHRSRPTVDKVRWLSSERPTGTVVRQVRLDRPAEAGNITARYTDGVLTLDIQAQTGSRRRQRPLRQPWQHEAHVVHGTAA